MNTLGQRIAAFRKERGLTQDELAVAMNISPQAVSKWENDISCPDITALGPLADFFHITIDELLRGEAAAQARMVPTGQRDLNKVLMKVTVDSPDGDKVRVNLPFSLIKAGLEIGMQMPRVGGSESLKEIDFSALVRVVEQGAMGKLVEVDDAGGTHIDIWVE